MRETPDWVDQMGEIIQGLLDKGLAYQVNGNIDFEIAKFPEYGKLSNEVLDELDQGSRIEIHEEKRDPRDFALWRVDPKHLMQWDANFRDSVRCFPGWHIECSAMSMSLLETETLDIHTSGEDNLFPHQECEVAQSEAFTGKPFASMWLHVKHLMVDGKKMSKSLGNFFTVQDLLDKGYSGAELRYALMRAQYRQGLNFTLKCMDEARTALGRVEGTRKRLVRIREGVEAGGDDDLADAVRLRGDVFTAALGDDPTTSGAIAAVFGLVSDSNMA